MPRRILWVSQHPMNRVQIPALKRMFGEDVQVHEDPRPFDNAESILRRVREGGYDDCIVVGPLSVLDRMVALGLRPLYCEAEQVRDKSLADWSVKGRYYRFVRFCRVKRLVLELEDLGLAARRQESD